MEHNRVIFKLDGKYTNNILKRYTMAHRLIQLPRYTCWTPRTYNYKLHSSAYTSYYWIAS